MATTTTLRLAPVLSPRATTWVLGAALGLAFLVLVFGSLFFLTGFSHGVVVPPWSFPLRSWVAFLLVGLFSAVLLTRLRDQYLRLVFVFLALTSGMYVLRFPILDEWVCMAATAAGLFMAATGAVARKPRADLSDLWQVFFLAWVLHLLGMSLFGLAAFGNPKALRFVVLYSTLLAFALLMFFYDFPKPTSRQLKRSLLFASAFYYLLVLMHWKIAKASGLQPHILEGIGFAGTAYLCIFSILSVPLALNELLVEKRTVPRWFAVLVLLLAMTVALLSDSRAGFWPFVLSFGVASLLYPVRAIKLVALAFVSTIGMSLYFYHHPFWPFDILGSILDGFQFRGGSMTYEYYGRTVTAARGDSGRILYGLAGLKALLTNPEYFLSGAGNYSFFPVAGDTFAELARASGVNTSIVNYGLAVGGISEPPRPPALGAYTLETGLLGITLFLFCFLACLLKILVEKVSVVGGYRLRFKQENLFLVVPLLCLPMWTYFGEIQDILFMYLLVAPNGILSLLATPDPESVS